MGVGPLCLQLRFQAVLGNPLLVCVLPIPLALTQGFGRRDRVPTTAPSPPPPRQPTKTFIYVKQHTTTIEKKQNPALPPPLPNQNPKPQQKNLPLSEALRPTVGEGAVAFVNFCQSLSNFVKFCQFLSTLRGPSSPRDVVLAFGLFKPCFVLPALPNALPPMLPSMREARPPPGLFVSSGACSQCAGAQSAHPHAREQRRCRPCTTKRRHHHPAGRCHSVSSKSQEFEGASLLLVQKGAPFSTVSLVAHA